MEWRKKECSLDPGSYPKQTKRIGNQFRTVALRPGTDGKRSTPVSGKHSLVFMFFGTEHGKSSENWWGLRNRFFL